MEPQYDTHRTTCTPRVALSPRLAAKAKFRFICIGGGILNFNSLESRALTRAASALEILFI